MEGLLLILIDLIAAPLFCIVAGAVSLAASSLGAILSGLIEMVSVILSTLFNRPRASGKPHLVSQESDDPGFAPIPAPVPPKREPPRWPRRLLVASLSLLGLIIAAVLVINAWFMDDLLRWALARQEKRSGVHVEVGAIQASMLSGRYGFRDIRVTRQNHPAGEIDLSARSADVSLSLWSAWKRTVPIDSVAIDGLRGRYHLGQPAEKKAGPSGVADLERKPPRRFAIDELEITDVSIEVTEHTTDKPLSLPITLTRLVSSPFRSRWALFDILFRSNAEGSLMGRPFTITTGGDDAGRVAAWSVSELPVEALSVLVGGPFSIITKGRCDVRVVDRWSAKEEGFIDMDWKLVLRDVHGEVPAGLTGFRRTLAIAVVAMLNANPKEVPLGFSLRIDRHRFEGASTLEATGLWEAVDLALTQELARRTRLPPEKIEQFKKTPGKPGRDSSKAGASARSDPRQKAGFLTIKNRDRRRGVRRSVPLCPLFHNAMKVRYFARLHVDRAR